MDVAVQTAIRTRRAAVRPGHLDFYYKDYHGENHANKTVLPDVADPPPAYFRYIDNDARDIDETMATLETASTKKEFNPDDYVDDNYEALIVQDPQAKPSTTDAKHVDEATTAANKVALRDTVTSMEDADDAAPRQPVLSGDPYLPLPPSPLGERKKLHPKHSGKTTSSDDPTTLLSTASLLATSTETSTTVSSGGSHRFRVADALNISVDEPRSGLQVTVHRVPSTPSPLSTPVASTPETYRSYAGRQQFMCSGRQLDTFYVDPSDCKIFHYCSPGFTRSQLLDFRFRCEDDTVYQAESNRCAPGKCPNPQVSHTDALQTAL